MQFPILDDCVTVMQYKLLFTAQERIAIYALQETDAVVKDLLRTIDDPRCTTINLKLPSTRQALEYLVSVDALEESRIEEILQARAQ